MAKPSMLARFKPAGRERPQPERRRRPRPATEGFWDRPPLVNMLADMLFLFGVLALCYAALLLIVRQPAFPLNQVVVVSPLDQVTRTQVEYAVHYAAKGNFFTVDLDSLRSSFEKLPWVRKASVRRLWPDALEVELEEHVAEARWQNRSGESRLVNRQGEVFAAALASQQLALPVFDGPNERAAEMLERYREFVTVLAPLQQKPKRLVLSAREAWQLQLENGLVIDLGREQQAHGLHERLRRFVSTYDELKTHLPFAVAAVDMRYPNGFALRAGQSVSRAATAESRPSIGAASKGRT